MPDCSHPEVRIAYALVEKHCEVAFNLRILREFLEGNLVPFNEFEEHRPADFGHIDRLLYAELAGKRRIDRSHNCKLGTLSREFVDDSFGEYVGRCSIGPKLVDVGAEAFEKQFEITLENEEIALAGSIFPGLLAGAGNSEAEGLMFFVAFKGFA